MDVFDGNPFSAHEPGLFDGFGECGIYDPAMENVSGSIAALADLDRLTHEPTRRCARHGPVGGEHVLESALDVVAEILEEFAVGKVNDGLIKAAEIVIGNVILDGVHGEAAHTQQGAVVLGIIDVAGKAAVLPEDDAVIEAARIFKVADHGQEAVPADDRGTRAGFIGIDRGEDEVILGAPGDHPLFLLGDGEILFVAAGIAQVGHDAGVLLKDGIICFVHYLFLTI